MTPLNFLSFPLFPNACLTDSLHEGRSYSTTSKTSSGCTHKNCRFPKPSRRIIVENISQVQQNIFCMQILDANPSLRNSEYSLEYTIKEILKVSEWIAREFIYGTVSSDIFTRPHFEQLRNIYCWWNGGVSILNSKKIILTNEQATVLKSADFLLKSIHEYADIYYKSLLGQVYTERVSKFVFWQRESSRGWVIASRSILIILSDLRSPNPGAFSKPKIQILKYVQYNPNCLVRRKSVLSYALK